MELLVVERERGERGRERERERAREGGIEGGREEKRETKKANGSKKNFNVQYLARKLSVGHEESGDAVLVQRRHELRHFGVKHLGDLARHNQTILESGKLTVTSGRVTGSWNAGSWRRRTK